MELKDLVGLHELSGVDTTTTEKVHYGRTYEHVNAVRFVLNGKTYKAIDDTEDDYRSYCKELQVCDEVVSNNFPPQKVIAKMKEDDIDGKHNTIQLFDVVTNRIVLEVGTDRVDNMYPYCVMIWSPENLACNIGR